jgi:hypothetical protein
LEDLLLSDPDGTFGDTLNFASVKSLGKIGEAILRRI